MDETTLLWAQWGPLNADRYRFLVRLFGDLKTAWRKTNAQVLAQMGFGAEKVARLLTIRESLDLFPIVREMEELGVEILNLDDPDYPEPLRIIANAPAFLFVRGSIPPIHKSLGIVGTRSISSYGQKTTVRLVRDLVNSGFTIVSGLAMGVDACAHTACLESQGPTVAVLGCGVDLFYPATNRPLAERILKNGGCILSEYPLGTPALAHHFPARNRIISGLSQGVLVVEGGVKSGALITARYALEQGREVFAIPSAAHGADPSGTNHLIRRGEAKLVEKAEDILEEFGFAMPATKPLPLEADEADLLKRIGSGKTLDELAEETNWNVAKLSEILIRLQLKGVSREIGGKWHMI